ncbi:MAG: phosphoribosyl-ATP diphosphatase [Alphaproteobacteria bacterium]|nr:phosphoribosyl-ATP diphosphatase [Alphaproteobacteria bacterium]
MSDILTKLEAIIEQRKSADPDSSYIAKRLKQGTEKIAQKFGEEAVETIIAAMKRDKKEIVSESADMIFHWLLLLADAGVSMADVMEELSKREGTSGLDEKARRKMKE